MRPLSASDERNAMSGMPEDRAAGGLIQEQHPCALAHQLLPQVDSLALPSGDPSLQDIADPAGPNMPELQFLKHSVDLRAHCLVLVVRGETETTGVVEALFHTELSMNQVILRHDTDQERHETPDGEGPPFMRTSAIRRSHAVDGIQGVVFPLPEVRRRR